MDHKWDLGGLCYCCCEDGRVEPWWDQFVSHSVEKHKGIEYEEDV